MPSPANGSAPSQPRVSASIRWLVGEIDAARESLADAMVGVLTAGTESLHPASGPAGAPTGVSVAQVPSLGDSWAMAPRRIDGRRPTAPVIVHFYGDSDRLTPESVAALDALIPEPLAAKTCSATVTGFVSRKVAKDPRRDLVRHRLSEVARRLLAAGVDGGISARMQAATPLRGPRPGEVRVEILQGHRLAKPPLPAQPE
jgi:outer membrane protein OmpA-like peptidoglycan-associated protein